MTVGVVNWVRFELLSLNYKEISEDYKNRTMVQKFGVRVSSLVKNKETFMRESIIVA